MTLGQCSITAFLAQDIFGGEVYGILRPGGNYYFDIYSLNSLTDYNARIHMPFRVVRNDITKMNTEAIVNTANAAPTVGTGCDMAIYNAAGYDKLLEFRKSNIGDAEPGEAFITPGFELPAKYIIHAVSPLYTGGNNGEEELLRACYSNSLKLAKDNGIQSVAIPLIGTGGFGYPREEGMIIAAEEINAFLKDNQMEIVLVVFDDTATKLGNSIEPGLREYIDKNYVQAKISEEYAPYVSASGPVMSSSAPVADKSRGRRAFSLFSGFGKRKDRFPEPKESSDSVIHSQAAASRPTVSYPGAAPYPRDGAPGPQAPRPLVPGGGLSARQPAAPVYDGAPSPTGFNIDDEEALLELNRKLDERLAHRTDTFSEYLLYLIEQRGMKNSEVYNRAIIDKRYFSHLKVNKYFHPEKIKALCLCVGAKLTLDETKDLLARAGYALSPCDLTDIIFAFYIEHGHYDVIDIDIQLEEHGLPCIIA